MKRLVTKRGLVTLLALVIFFVFCFSSLTYATPWTAAGSTGTIDESSLDLFSTGLSSLYFRAEMTGYLIARYNVTNPFDWQPIHENWNVLNVSF